MKITTDEQDERLNAIRNEVDRIAQLPPCGDAELDTLTRNIVQRLRRSLDQFNSNIVVIVALGMLKAGKSTLINLLARTPLASPVGYGIDTTLRPVLVHMGEPGDDHGSITIYDRPGELSNQEALSAIIDHMRGLLDLQNRIRSRSIPLTEENLRRTLCCSVAESRNLLTSEPVLVVVQTPYNSNCKLLSDRRMLLDMPGLDSAEADIAHLTEDYAAAIKECDLMLFVQSSVAPLNEKACEFLQAILDLRDSATSWIIQNLMLSKHWRQQSCINRELKTQSEYAAHTINRIQKRQKREPQTCFVNLGMAYDALLGNPDDINPESRMPDGTPVTREQLWQSSHFDQLEENLLRDLQENGTDSRLRHCLDELNATLKTLKQQLETQLQRLDQQLDSSTALKTRWQNTDKEVSNNLSRYEYHREGDLSLCNEPDFSCLATIRSEQYPGMSSNEAQKGSTIDAYLKACSQAMHQACCRFLKEASIGSIALVTSERTLRGSEICNREIKDCFDSLMERLEENHKDCYNAIKREDRPRYTLNDRQHPLNLDAAANGQFPLLTPNRSFEETRTVLLLFSKEKRWEPQSSIIQDSLNDLRQRYLQATADSINANVSHIFGTLIRQGLEQGSAAFRQQIRRNLEQAEDSCAAAAEQKQRAGDLLRHINNFITSLRP